ncbi:MAG: imidazolonepropionase-like amidohydrolase [Planctomycetota bacterium]|jgi:imidazolonepropionase-like amidohydrolase
MISILTTLLLAAPASQAAAPEAPMTSWSVFADKVYTSTGSTLENALVIVTDGKITAITPGAKAKDDSLRATTLTAGLVDASARINVGNRSVEQSSEVTPSVSMEYGVDAFDPRWERLTRTGVTTAFVPPLNRNVVGGLGIVLKTAGPESIEARMVKGADMLCGAIGSLPSSGNRPASGRPTSFYNRRPTTRMGVEWEWRKAFFDAAQAPAEGAGKDIDILQDVLAGKTAAFIQAYPTQDIRTAVFLKEEMQREGFGEMRLVIDGGAEAWREPDLLTRSSTAVILPPMPAQGRTTDSAFMAVNTAKVLQDAGVQFALSGHDALSASIGMQAGLAMRGGLTREQALRAVTITPAQILGIDSQVGTVEVGKDADLVLWNGEPFEATSRPIGVLVNGVLAVDPR